MHDITQREWARKANDRAGIYADMVTHVRRRMGTQHAEMAGIAEASMRRLGHSNTDKLSTAYLSPLHRNGMRDLAGFTAHDQASAWWPHNEIKLPEVLKAMLWPDVEIWERAFDEARKGQRDDVEEQIVSQL